jgi:hypothetical protein
MSPKKDKRVWRDIVFDSGDQSYAGSYAVARRMVYVRSGIREKATQIGRSTPELLARFMIIEISGETK